jgi:hypothetical protein
MKAEVILKTGRRLDSCVAGQLKMLTEESELKLKVI